MPSRGFTLVELLIVIAILAILAGILFPVLAQALVGAKMTGSISNLNQIGLGTLLYANDSDDGLPLYADGDASQVGAPGSQVLTWVGTTQPYLRTYKILVDPLMGDPHRIYSGGDEATQWNQNAYPDYGINYVFLSPWIWDASTNLCSKSASVSETGATHPSTTLLFTTTYEPNEDVNGKPVGGYSNYGEWIVTAPGALWMLQGSEVDCVWPGMDWTQHPGTFNAGQPFTAEASQRYRGGGVNEFLDGHAKYLTAGQEAAGTDWATSPYGSTKVTSSAKYLWSFDDQFFGKSVPE